MKCYCCIHIGERLLRSSTPTPPKKLTLRKNRSATQRKISWPMMGVQRKIQYNSMIDGVQTIQWLIPSVRNAMVRQKKVQYSCRPYRRSEVGSKETQIYSYASASAIFAAQLPFAERCYFTRFRAGSRLAHRVAIIPRVTAKKKVAHE